MVYNSHLVVQLHPIVSHLLFVKDLQRNIVMAQHIMTLRGLEGLPTDVIHLFLLQLPPSLLKELCSSSKRLHSVCRNPTFRETYKREKDVFKMELKRLFVLYMTIPNEDMYYPVSTYFNYQEYIDRGIPIEWAYQMAAEKAYQEFLFDPQKTWGYAKDFHKPYYAEVLYDKPLTKPIVKQEILVTKLAKKMHTQASQTWYTSFYDFYKYQPGVGS